VERAPIIEDCGYKLGQSLVNFPIEDRIDETSQNLRSILPGLSWNQYWFFGSLTRASNFLRCFC